jgi:hypothetical protein
LLEKNRETSVDEDDQEEILVYLRIKELEQYE